MQRRHFELIAQVISNAGCLSSEVRFELARLFAEELSKHNANFNLDMFLKACDKGDIT